MLHRRLSLGLAAAFLVCVAAGAFFVALAGAGTQPVTLSLSKGALQGIVAPLIAPALPAPQSLFGKSRIHVLVLGRDYDYTANDIEYSTESRSDIIMAFTVDFPTHTITELSVPRDTAITMPDGSQQKINAALSSGGVPESQRVVSRYLGVPFDRYFLLRIDSTKQLIDAIGGVDVAVHQQVDYDDTWGHMHVHLKPGMHHLDGDQAVSYVRFRHDWCGDPCRIARQQDVLHAIATKLRNDGFNDVIRAQALIGVIRNNVSTNLSTRELMSLAWDFRDVDPHAIRTAQVPFTGDVQLADGDALVPDDAAKQRLVQRLMLGSFAPPSVPTGARFSPAAISVEVHNGTQSDGPDKALAARLKRAGFTQTGVADANRLDYSSSEIRVAPGGTAMGAAVRDALGVQWAATPIVEDLPVGGSPAVVVLLGSDLIAER